MKHEEGFFRSIRDTNIFWQTWLPDGDPQAVLVLVHGYDDHSGRFMNIVNHFVPKGFAIYSLDHIGHGKSEGTRVYIQKFEDYTKTLQTFMSMVRNRQAGKSVFLIGYSMGGLISSIYLLENQKEFAGAVMISPGVKVPNDISALTIFIGKILSVILPKAGLLDLDDTAISKDHLVVEAYMADPENAEMLFNLIQSKDKQIKLYEGLYHELFSEPEREMVFADTEEWLNRQIGHS